MFKPGSKKTRLRVPAFNAIPKRSRTALAMVFTVATQQCVGDASTCGLAATALLANQDAANAVLAKFLIAGLVTWVFEACLGHLLEFVKIAKQTSDDSYYSIVRRITREKGFLGLWDGFFPWGTVQALLKGSVFGAANVLMKVQLAPLVAENRLSPGAVEVIAGGFGGGVQGLVLSPTLLLKTRVMTDAVFREKMGFWQTNLQSALVGARVIRTEGIRALMKGAGVFSSKRVFDWSTRYFFAEIAEATLFAGVEKLSMAQKMIASLVGGSLSACVTLPMDVATSQIQQASKAGQTVHLVDLFVGQIQSGGLKQMVRFASRGFAARMLHVALTTVAMKTVTTIVFEYFFNKQA